MYEHESTISVGDQLCCRWKISFALDYSITITFSTCNVFWIQS